LILPPQTFIEYQGGVMFEYLRLIKLDWFTDSGQGWHGHPPLMLIAIIAVGLVIAYFVLKRN
jgi:hypothetical protein